MSKIILGELGNYLPKSLLEKTNFDEFISQEIVDEINAMLIQKNPNHYKSHKREWDYAEFTTENEYFFVTYSIFEAAYVNPEFDTLMTEIQYTFNGKEYFIKGFEDGKRVFIGLGDNESSLFYDKNGKRIKYEHTGETFKIADVPLTTSTNI